MATNLKQNKKTLQAGKVKVSNHTLKRDAQSAESDFSEHERQSSSEEDTAPEFERAEKAKRAFKSDEKSAKKQKKAKTEDSREDSKSPKANPTAKTKKTLSNPEKMERDLKQISHKKPESTKIILKNQDKSSQLILKSLKHQEKKIQQMQESLQVVQAKTDLWKEDVREPIRSLLKNNKKPTPLEIRDKVERKCKTKLEELLMQDFSQWWILGGQTYCLDYARDVRAHWNQNIRQYWLKHHDKVDSNSPEQVKKALKEYTDDADKLMEVAQEIYGRDPTDNDMAWVYFAFSKVARGEPIKIDGRQKKEEKVRDPKKPKQKLDPKILMKLALNMTDEEEEEMEEQEVQDDQSEDEISGQGEE